MIARIEIAPHGEIRNGDFTGASVSSQFASIALRDFMRMAYQWREE
jgi:hypothetical protein